MGCGKGSRLQLLRLCLRGDLSLRECLRGEVSGIEIFVQKRCESRISVKEVRGSGQRPRALASTPHRANAGRGAQGKGVDPPNSAMKLW